jgi:hypothetical protein
VVTLLGVRERRWKLIRWLVMISVVTAMLTAGAGLWSDAQNRLPDEAYSLRGWWMIWFVGVYVAGMVVLVSLGWAKLLAWLRARFGKHGGTPAPSAA